MSAANLWVRLVCLWVFAARAALVTYTGTQNLRDGTWFIMFHVAWCKHCLDVKPDFISVALTSPLKFLTLDCVNYLDLCRRYEITSFPTFMYVAKGQETVYEGSYHRQAIDEYARKLTSPIVQHITVGEWEKKVATHSAAFTLTYSPQRDSHILSMFERAAERFKTQPLFFYAVAWEDTKVIATSRDGNDKYELVSINERTLQEFIHLNKMPALIEVSSDRLLTYKRSFRDKLLFVLVVDTHDLDTTYRLSQFYSEARKHRMARETDVQFCYIDVSSADADLELLSPYSLPAVVALRTVPDDPQHAVHLDPSVPSVSEFIQDVQTATHKLSPLRPGLKYYIRSFSRWLASEGGEIDFATWVSMLTLLLLCGALVILHLRRRIHEKSS